MTDDRIVLLNEEDNDDAVKKISAMDKAPTFEERDVRGITSGKLDYEEGPWTTTIEIKGNECTYLASHNSGHFTKIVWKRGLGWLNTRAATARMLMDFVLSGRNKLPGSNRVVLRYKNFAATTAENDAQATKWI